MESSVSPGRVGENLMAATEKSLGDGTVGAGDAPRGVRGDAAREVRELRRQTPAIRPMTTFPSGPAFRDFISVLAPSRK